MKADPEITRGTEAPEMRGTLAVGIVIVGILAVFTLIELSGFRETVPPRSRTYQAMVLVKAHVLRAASAAGAAPASLDDLELVAESGEPLRDGWGRAIEYRVDDDTVALLSLGADGERHGLAQDQDLVGVFALRDEAGAWSAEDVDWLVDPLSYHSGDALPDG